MRRRLAVRSRAGVTVLFAANGLSVGAWAASIPRVAERLSLAPLAIAAMVFVASFGAIVATRFVGRAIDRHGGRPLALLGAAFVPATLVLCVEAPSIAVLYAASFALGLASGTMDVAMNAYAVAAERAARASWISQVHGAWSVGNVVGTLMIAGLVAHGIPLPSAVCAFPIAVGVAFFARVAPHVRHDIAHGDVLPAARRALVMLGVLAAFGLSIEGTVSDWAALYVHRNLGASLVAAPLTLAAFSASMMVTRFVGDAAILRFGRVATLCASAALSSVALAAALLAPTALGATIAFAVAGVGCANLAPVLFSAAGRIGAGSGMATVTGIGYTAFLGGPAAIGAVAQAAGLRAALCIAVASAAVVAFATLVPELRSVLRREEDWSLIR